MEGDVKKFMFLFRIITEPSLIHMVNPMTRLKISLKILFLNRAFVRTHLVLRVSRRNCDFLTNRQNFVNLEREKIQIWPRKFTVFRRKNENSRKHFHEKLATLPVLHTTNLNTNSAWFCQIPRGAIDPFLLHNMVGKGLVLSPSSPFYKNVER